MLFLLALGGAIASFQIYCRLSDEISRLITGLTSQVCLFLSLVYAPWLIKIAAVFAIVLLLPDYRRNAL